MTGRARLAGVALALACVAAAIAASAAPAPAAGDWQGAITVFGTDLEIRLHVRGPAESLAATIDIPAQGVDRMPLRDVRARGDSVAFTLPTPAGDAVFAGIQRGDSLTGAFAQAGITAGFRLARGPALAPPADPPPPYAVEEVKVPGPGLTLAGTLTLPRGAGPWPAVVLVSGSGPQNRDEEILGFRPFRLIADHLTRHGIAVLRTDDRGVGGSGGAFAGATSEDFAADLAACVRYLRTRREIAPRRIGALGHSEGGIVVPMVAARSDSLAFVVLLAAPGIRGDSLLVVQGELITEAMGMSDTLRALQREAQAALIRAGRTGTGWEEARTATRRVLRHALAAGGVQASDSLLEAQAAGQIAVMQGAWMKGFLAHEPAPVLARVRQPVLALFGALDLQVPPSVNAPAVEHALRRNRDATVRVIPRANHLFQETDSGSPLLYATLRKEFAPGVLDTLSGWIAARTRR